MTVGMVTFDEHRQIRRAPTRSGRTRADEIYSDIRAAILTGIYLPATRLSPGLIANHHSVSVTVVREALTRLAAEHLVRSQSQQGFSVASVTADELADLTSVRLTIDVSALRFSMAKNAVAWQARVVAAHHTLTRVPDTAPQSVNAGEDFAEAHRDFHTALLSGCDSPRLMQLSARLYDETELYRRLSRPFGKKKRKTAQEHRSLMDTTLNGDVEGAVALLTAHYQHTVAIIVESGILDRR